MFCPMGYVTAGHVQQVVARLLEENSPPPKEATEIIAYFDAKNKSKELSKVEWRGLQEVKEIEDWMDEHRFMVDFFTHFVLQKAPSLGICSPQGILLKISDDVLIEPDFSQVKLHEFLFDREDGHGLKYVFISPDFWTVTLANWTEFLHAENKETVSGKEYSYILRIAEILGSFEGHSITISEEDVPTSISDLDKAFQGLIAQNEARAGRPPEKIINTVKLYTELFPNGHEGFSKPQVVRALESAGLHISVDTLNRAIKKIEAK